MIKDRRIFVDTGAYLALFHKADHSYQQACNAWLELEKQQRIIYTTNHIVDYAAFRNKTGFYL
jgi:predicted nucleic acid-binding protein